jgi:hypothetical protein
MIIEHGCPLPAICRPLFICTSWRLFSEGQAKAAGKRYQIHRETPCIIGCVAQRETKVKLIKSVVQLALVSIVTSLQAADALRYTLLPGSTITPIPYGIPSGPAEPLTGSLEWIQFETASPLIGFDAARLEFQSDSFLIKLNTNDNWLGSSVFPDSCLTYFGEIVDLTGLGISTGRMGSQNDGCYSGPPDRPTSLHYPNVRITSIDTDHHYVAMLDIVAALDSDGDGVPDDSDQCPNTPVGAIVDGHGCSIDQLVPCPGPVLRGARKNHSRYVTAVREMAVRFLSEGLITQEEARAIVKEARRARCGRE